MTIIVNWTSSAGAWLDSFYFFQDIRAVQEAHNYTVPAGENRGGLPEYFFPSDIGPKMTYKSMDCKKKRYNRISERNLE